MEVQTEVSKASVFECSGPCSADVVGDSEYKVLGWFFTTLNLEGFGGWVVDDIQKGFANSRSHLGVASLLVAAQVFIVE